MMGMLAWPIPRPLVTPATYPVLRCTASEPVSWNCAMSGLWTHPETRLHGASSSQCGMHRVREAYRLAAQLPDTTALSTLEMRWCGERPQEQQWLR